MLFAGHAVLPKHYVSLRGRQFQLSKWLMGQVLLQQKLKSEWKTQKNNATKKLHNTLNEGQEDVVCTSCTIYSR